MGRRKKKRGSFDMVEEALEEFHELKKEIDSIEHDLILATKQSDDSGGGRSNLTSDTVSELVVTLDDHARLQHLRKITQAIEKTLQKCDEDTLKMVEVAYWSKRPRNWHGIALELNVHYTTAIRWRKALILQVERYMGYRAKG
jgi:RinA family phage transcriptional activator